MDLKEKYPIDRDDMSLEMEREFVKDWFVFYEEKGFSKVFWSLSSDYEKYNGIPFKVLKQLTESECDLCSLPMWEIELENGEKIQAYPDEVIVFEMLKNGCTLDIVQTNKGEQKCAVL